MLEVQGDRLDRWDAALGNAADAQVALDVIERAIDDAVYLGEDAFNQLLPVQAYTRTIQVFTSWRIVPAREHAIAADICNMSWQGCCYSQPSPMYCKKNWICTNREQSFLALVAPGGLSYAPRPEKLPATGACLESFAI